MSSPTLPASLLNGFGSSGQTAWQHAAATQGATAEQPAHPVTPERPPLDATGNRAAANLRAVLATAQAITSNLNLSQTLGTLADHLEMLIPHDGLWIAVIDDNAQMLRPLLFRNEEGQAVEGWDIPLGRGIVSRAVRERTVMLVNDAHNDPESYYPPDFTLPAPEHVLVVPLNVGYRKVGALILRRLGDRRFTDEDRELASVLGEQAAVAIHAALLFEEERRQHNFAAALGDVAAALNSAVTLEELGQRLGTAAVRAVGVQCCSLHIYDELAESTVASYYIGVNDLEERTTQLSRAAPRTMPVERELLETGRPVSGARLLELLTELPTADRLGMRGGAAIPLRVKDRVQGAMYVWTPAPPDADPSQPHPTLDASDLSLLETIGDQAGVAIERARLYAKSEQHRRELQVLADVNGVIAGSLDIQTIVVGALKHMHALIHFDVAWITLWDEERDELRISEVWGSRSAHMKGVKLDLDDTINGAVFLSGQRRAGAVGDGLADPDRQKLIGGGRYYLCLPVAVESRLLGTMYLSREDPEPFSAAETTLAEIVAGHVAIGIERSRGFSLALAERQRSVRQAQNLRAVLASSQRLALESDLESTLAAISAGVAELIPNAACTIAQADLRTRELHVLHNRNTDDVTIVAPRLPFGSGISGQVAEERRPLRFAHLEQRPEYDPNVFDGRTVKLAETHGLHLMSVPLTAEGTLIGICTVTRLGGEPFTNDEFSSLQIFAGQAAAAIRNADLLARNRDLYLGGIRALVSAIDAKDAYTRGHSERVSQLSRRIAERMGLGVDASETIELAGLLHDIGKIGVPDAILKKPTQLDDAESVIMMAHAALGAAILARAGAEGMDSLVPLVRHHHEWVNGCGYPDGLSGDEIPLGSAIIGVADAYDTMVTDRPYRSRCSPATAIADLRRATGRQFRADVVEALAQLVVEDPLLANPADANPLIFRAGELNGDRRHVNLLGLPAAGQIGDVRPLGLLVELATMTSYIPDLPAFLEGVTRMIQRRLGYQDVRMLLTDADQKMLSVAAHCSASNALPIGTSIPIDAPLYSEVLAAGEPRLIAMTGDEGADGDDWGARARSELVIPLVVDAAPIGLIDVASSRPDAFSADDIALLTAIGGQIAAAVHVAQLHDTTKRAAMTDGLTNLANYRAFYQALEAAIADGRRSGEGLSIIILDVQGLKQVNDTSGHLAGDAFLRRIAMIIRDAVRPKDTVARYGGDEFAIILPEATDRRAINIARAIRRRLALDPLNYYGSSIRFGIATFPSDGKTPLELVATADRRLYEMREQELKSPGASSRPAPMPLRPAR